MPLRKCPYCKGLSNFTLGDTASGGLLSGVASLDVCQNCLTPIYYVCESEQERTKILDSYPKLEVEPDEELPEDVKTAFREALRALDDGIWNGCIIMCRRALDEAMSDLQAEGRDLFQQIDDLEKKSVITPQMKSWTHEARMQQKLGAPGTKDKKWATRKDAEEVLEFCKWLFRYAYVLPKQLGDVKEKIESQTPQELPGTSS
jgi:hypothetical protein